MHSYVCLLVLLIRFPVLFRSLQYLQLDLLQKVKPLLLGAVPLMGSLVTGVCFPGPEVDCSVVFTGGPLSVGVKKSLILLCCVTRCGVTPMSLLSAVVGAGMCGSTTSSPCSRGMFALTSRSRRFFGLLYPMVSFLL